MSAAAKPHSDHHEPKEFVVTTFSSKPKVRSPSRDILWSEVWDAESPMTLGHPFRWVLQATEDKIRIRDLGKESDRIVTNPVEDIPFEELSKHGAIELSEGKRKYWVLIQPVRDLKAIEKDTGAWTPTMITAAGVSDAVASQFLKKCSMGVAGTMLLSFLILYLLPTPKPSEELIPEQFAKVLLSPAVKSGTSAPRQGGSPGAGSVNVVAAFQSEAVQKTTKTLMSSKAAKALLSGSTLLNASAASAQARKVFDSKSAMSKTITNPNLDAKATTGITMIGGTGNGKGTGTGQGYGAGGATGVIGQGTSLVGIDGAGMGIAEGLTKDQVGAVIREHMAEIRYCYESALLRKPGLEGKLVASFTVKPDGMGSAPKVKESSGDKSLDDCIMNRIVKWKFPKPKGGVSVAISYPFIFKSLGN